MLDACWLGEGELRVTSFSKSCAVLLNMKTYILVTFAECPQPECVAIPGQDASIVQKSTVKVQARTLIVYLPNRR